MDITEEASSVEAGPACANCGSSILDVNSKTPFCEPCRNQFIKYPVPLWIRIFGGVIVLVLVVSLTSLSANLQTGIHLKKGKLAAQQKNFLTAENEFKQVVKKEPEYLEAKCHLLIAAYHNGDFNEVISVSNELEGKEIKDNFLYTEASVALSNSIKYLPGDSFAKFLESYQMEIKNVPEAEWARYLQTNTEDVFAETLYASIQMDANHHAATDSLLNDVLAKDHSYHAALMLKIPVKREMLQFDSSYYYADALLKENHECSFALASKVRTMLKEKKDDEALNLAKKCFEMDEKDGYVLASLALAYHYKNDFRNRDLIIQKGEKDTAAAENLTFAKDVISGKEKFRN